MGEGQHPVESRCTCASQADALQRLLLRDDVDTAIDAGLMAFMPCPDCASITPAPTRMVLIADAQQRLRRAWDARDRYLARQQRLQRRAAEREAKRRQPPVAATNVGDAAGNPAASALPAAAAALLARAKAKAAQRNSRS
ncbi:hypothetical protein [Pseudoxanthomonas dokdonensis]|uniref:Uncharacterized protein n=1 Tax=Pseudoxanthomonas dokdonensis TaxID=344882 RepID=A0A0R0CGR5_9GAMM|nr:hypothetical protein [Pseudoxanthomonas dokdonensis]KRG69001.1 hypothetical protein ABB29_11210 [Pseudoxanthomonas dokdonensis]